MTTSNTKTRWRIETSMGTVETAATSARKAKRNARFRLIMSDREYKRPRPSDLAAMRDIEIVRCVQIGNGARRFFCGGSTC